MKQDHSVPKGFQKKVYTKLSASKITDQVSSSISQIGASKGTKIVATSVNNNLREGFKKMFLPLLIDIFELRQATQNFKNRMFSEELIETSIADQPPEQILEKLEEIQMQIQEAQNWCEGVVVQISKGIHEAKVLLEEIEHLNRDERKKAKKTKTFLKSIINLFNKTADDSNDGH
ncbi:MAG: hypothetical protein K9M07_00370 [Simkaniaceae bacterium]|nr:hypothetical protein [Simkaniaceae bacterium]MCF7851677.1 hypothetical protein [Simkaniaceae bacterium]